MGKVYDIVCESETATEDMKNWFDNGDYVYSEYCKLELRRSDGDTMQLYKLTYDSKDETTEAEFEKLIEWLHGQPEIQVTRSGT